MKKVIRLIFLASIVLSFAVAKGEVTKVYAHYESATKSSYNKNGHKLKWGRGNNLVIDGFEYQGTHYKYQTMANKVKIIRHDNKNASGNPCGLFAERTSSGATYQYNPSFPTGCDMAKVMGGRIINVGALDLFRNSGWTAKNIERVDFIFEGGIKAPANAVDLEKAGHVVTEKSGNNPIKIAAILSLDANGKPASYGPLVGVHTGTGIDYGITKIYVKNKNNPISKQYLAFLVNEKKGTQGKPWYLTKTHEPLGMAFVSLKDLGVAAGSTYYGFSYFGEDVTSSHDLTKPETFPVDHLNDTADPYGGVAGYFQDEALPEIDSGIPFSCTSQSFVSFNTSDNGPREGDSQFDTISLSDGGLVNHKVLNGVNGVNSIGYNVKDNYIWGYNLKLDKLVRIDANGNTKLFDLPDGLPSEGYIAADVDANGVLYLAERGAHKIRRVDVNPNSDQFLKALTPLTIKNNKTISTADFAFNPKDGKLYYIEEESGGKVYSIDPVTGKREFVVNSGVDPYVVITFFDKDGNFYFNLGTGSADTNKLYKINMNDPHSATYFTDLDKGLTNGDGARCPNAEVVQPPATETLQAQDCSAAPSDMVTFNKEFDFDKNNDVTGDGGVGTVARYKNVATVNGQAIDLLVKVENLSGFSSLLNTDSTPKGFKFQKAGGDDPSVGFFIDQNRFDTKGTLYDATLRFTFVKHGTTEPVALNFESQVYDLDNFANRTEKVIIDKNDYKFFQLSEDSHIEGTILGDYHIFMNKENEDSSFPDKRASVKFVHENKSTFTMHFQHIKNKSMGQYGGKAGFNLVFGKTENGINTCQQPPAPAENECTLAFPGALSSTNDEIQINDQTKIYGTKNHTLITKSLSAKDTVRCDDAPCQASNTLAKTLAFDLDLGNGKDGDKILSDNQSLTISSNKEYTKFQTGQNNTITINGDLTIKSQSDFYINQGSKITINGNVVIYADKFDANQANQFTINGSLKIIANIFYLNSGNKLYNIPSADKFVVLAKDKVDINSQVDFKGLFYSGGDVQVNNDTHITGALTGNYIDVNDHSLIGYDTDAVQTFCGSSQANEPELVAEYRFDECSWNGTEGEVKDSIGDHNGTARGNANTTADGIINRSGRFNGVFADDPNKGDFVEIQNYALQNKEGSFSVAAWFKAKHLRDWNGLITTTSRDDRKGWALEIDTIHTGDDREGALAIVGNEMSAHNRYTYVTSSVKPAVDEWHHIVLVHDEDGMNKLYIDGHLENTVNKKVRTSSNPLQIAKFYTDQTLDWYFDGQIDEVKLWKGTLSDQEVLSGYNNEKNGKNWDGTNRTPVSCQEPITCSDKAIVIDYKKNNSTNPYQLLHEIDLVTGETVDYTMDKDSLDGSYINGFGYNIQDGYLWGSDVVNKGYIVRVSKDPDGKYVQKKFGPIDGLPSNESTYIGDIDENGYLYLYYRTVPGNGKSSIYKIDLNQTRSDFDVTQYVFNKKINIADMAINPADHKIYALDKLNNFYRLDVEAKKITKLAENVVNFGEGIYGSSFFDNEGYFYAIKNKNRKAVRIEINGDNVSAISFSSINVGETQYQNDGARCSKAPIKIDFADAPDSYGSTLESNGARHKLPASGGAKLYIGNGVTADSDARLVDADSDTPMTFSPLYVSDTQYAVEIPVHNDTPYTANLVAWIDFNGNGTFESSEGVAVQVKPEDRTVTLRWTVPQDIQAGDTYMRIRLSTDTLTTADIKGVKSDGEVEDHKFKIYAHSAYDAWNEIIQSSPKLQTQIVGKEFTPTLAKMEGDLNDTDMKVGIVDAAVCDSLNSANLDSIDLKPFTLTEEKNGHTMFHFMDSIMSQFLGGFVTRDNPLIIPQPPAFTVNKAMKKAKLFFVWKKNGVERRACSSDSFAVRPDKFIIDAPSSPVKAGESFTMKIKAVGASSNHNPVNGYNENITLGADTNASVKMDYNETKPKCTRGTLEAITQNLHFHNGVAEFTLKYPEVGKLNISVREIAGKEFASIDKNDSAGAVAISPVEDSNVTFSPAKIDFSWSVRNGDGHIYTYYNTLDTSINNNDPMAAVLEFETKILNESGQPVSNFKPECYARDVEIAIDASIHDDRPQVYKIRARYPDHNHSVAFSHLPSELTSSTSDLSGIKLDKSLFKEGIGKKKIEFNIERDASSPMNPMIYRLPSATAKLDDLNMTKTNDVNLTFLYVRAHMPDQKIVGKSGDAAVFYEVYCKDCNKTLYGLNGLPESVDSVYWYQWSQISEASKAFDPDFGSINKSMVDPSSITAISRPHLTGISQNVVQNKLHLDVSKAPFKTRVNYKPKKYLIYNPFKPSAVKQSFIVNFEPEPKSWAGKGNIGHTVDTNIAPRNNMDIIDW